MITTSLSTKKSAASGRSRGVRFTLRTFLLVFTALAVTIGVWAERRRRFEQAIFALRQAGVSVSTLQDREYSKRWFAWRITPGIPKPDPVPPASWFEQPAIVDAFPKSPWDTTDETLRLLSALGTVEQFNCNSTKVTPAGWRYLRSLTNMTTLDLRASSISDADLAHLHGMKTLHRLDLTKTKISDAGVPHLASLTSLRSLKIDWTAITETGVAELRRRLPRCSVEDESWDWLDLRERETTDETFRQICTLGTPDCLQCDSTRIGPAGWQCLRELTRVQRLYLDRSSISDADLAALRELKGLTWLDLTNTNITDGGLSHLASLNSLERLELDGTAITNFGLTHLYGLKNLKKVTIKPSSGVSGQLTTAGVEELRRHLPSCIVDGTSEITKSN